MNKFWAQGAVIDTIFLLVGAPGTQRASFGIYTGPGLTGYLGGAVVNVSGWSGVTANIAPIKVTPGQELYVAAQAITDVTVYNHTSGCFIGTVSGWSR